MSLHNIGRQGELRLKFERYGKQTVLKESYSCPPLQVMRALQDKAGCLCVYLLSPTGGVVQGDQYRFDIDIGEESHVLFTTQSATKVYRMPQGCAEQNIRIEVHANAIFEFVPDATILFSDSDFRQTIDVTLHPGALALIYEIVQPGRLASGEYLAFRRFANRIRIHDADGLILYDATDVAGSDDLNQIGKLEGYRCWGSAYLVGDMKRYRIDVATFCETHQPIIERDSAIGGLTGLFRDGLCMRMVSMRLETIYSAFHELRKVIRTQHVGLPDAPLRK